MRRESKSSKHYTKKSNKKEGNNEGNEQNIRDIGNKQQNGRSPSLSVITLNLNGLNFVI